jgi:predicted DNA-binding protein (UPF0251 family)
MEIIHLAQDELEALHLCDGNAMTQQEAGVCMGVSRGTVQRLVAAGREKVASALVHKKALAIGMARTTAVPAPAGTKTMRGVAT